MLLFIIPLIVGYIVYRIIISIFSVDDCDKTVINEYNNHTHNHLHITTDDLKSLIGDKSVK